MININKMPQISELFVNSFQSNNFLKLCYRSLTPMQLNISLLERTGSVVQCDDVHVRLILAAGDIPVALIPHKPIFQCCLLDWKIVPDREMIIANVL